MPHRLLLLLVVFIPGLLWAKPVAPAGVSFELRDAVQARIDGTYAVVVSAGGGKRLVPVASLTATDLAWLKQLAEANPVARGKSSMTVVAAEKPGVGPAKKTIEVSKIENGVETVQLCSPRVSRDQIGGTCMLYARVHWLDIAGYYVDAPAIYKIINNTPPNAPWAEPRYVNGLITIITDHKPRPRVHLPTAHQDAFEWAREQLRKGRPLLAAFPREIWQALPPGYVASRPWSGGSVGHQIVVNGFTYNSKTREGTFRIVNTWAELPEFDLKLEAAAGGNLVIEASMSPFGEPLEVVAKERVQSVTLIKSVGGSRLYEVTTNRGTRRILAPNEAAARRLAEDDS